MKKTKSSGGGSSGANPAATKQWEGHLRHQALLAQQEQDRKARRHERLRGKGK